MKYLTFILIMLTSLYSISGTKYEGVLVDKVVSVYDGDTFRVDVKGYPDIIGKNVPIRLRGADTPEIRGKCTYEKHMAKEAREFTKRILLTSKRIELRNLERGKYFRIVADVYVEGQSLSVLLIHNKLATPYNGGKKKNIWCKS